MNLAEVKSFGGTDADEDSLLLQSFEDHPSYIEILNHEKFCIVGRKGSGKTAIFKKILTNKAYNVFSFGHTFTDYPWHHHDRQRKIGVPEEQCYVHSWTYLCLISLAKILLNQDQSQPYSEAALNNMHKIEMFILDTYGSRDPDVSQIFSPSVKLKFSSNFGIDWAIMKASTKIESVEMNDLPTIIQEVNFNLKLAILESLNPEIDYYVLFDQLDLGFTKESIDYSLRLTGLLLAAKDLNNTARAMHKKMTVGAFLRDDIYDGLKFEDKNKITENNVAPVFWDHGPNHKTLKGLMERRFKVALQSDSPVAWSDIFDEDHTMASRQSKYNFMKDRTFLRPRDMIKFCNETLAAFKIDGCITDKFYNTHILTAQPLYSDYLYRELEDEIHKHVPMYANYVVLLKNLESLNFTRDDFIEVMKKCKAVLEKEDKYERIMRNLFEFSLIGYYTAGGLGGGADYVWKYKDQRSKFSDNATQFRVHPGFKDVFGLKKFSRSE